MALSLEYLNQYFNDNTYEKMLNSNTSKNIKELKKHIEVLEK